MPGLWLAVAAGRSNFTVWNAIQNVSTTTGVLHTGSLASAPAPGEWLALTLEVTAQGVASATANGVAIFAGIDVRGAVPDTGFPGIGTLDWGQFVLFDNFSVTGSA